MGRGYVTAAVRRTMGYPAKGYVPMGIRKTMSANQSMSTNQYPIGKEKYKYNPKLISIPDEKNGIVFTNGFGSNLSKVELPTNVDISELPYEVMRYFDANGMPIKKIININGVGNRQYYAYTSKQVHLVGHSTYPYDTYIDPKAKNTISVHNHPSAMAGPFSGGDIMNFAAENQFMSEVRPNQKSENNIINNLVDNKKAILNTLNDLKKIKSFEQKWSMISPNGKITNGTEVFNLNNKQSEKMVNAAYEYVTKLEKNTDNKFIHYQLTNSNNIHKIFKNKTDIEFKKSTENIDLKLPKAQHDAYHKMVREIDKNPPIISAFINKQLKNNTSLDNSTLQSITHHIDTIAFNKIMADKYKFDFEIKYS